MKHIKAGFSRMQVFCGDAEVTPIHPFKIEQRVGENNAVYEGLYVFDPARHRSALRHGEADAVLGQESADGRHARHRSEDRPADLVRLRPQPVRPQTNTDQHRPTQFLEGLMAKRQATKKNATAKNRATTRVSRGPVDAPGKRHRKPPPQERLDKRMGEPVGKQLGQKSAKMTRGRG